MCESTYVLSEFYAEHFTLLLWEVRHKTNVRFTVDRHLLFINIKHLTVLEVHSIAINARSIFNGEHGMLLCVITSASDRAHSTEVMGRFKHKLRRLFTCRDESTAGRRVHDEIASCL